MNILGVANPGLYAMPTSFPKYGGGRPPPKDPKDGKDNWIITLILVAVCFGLGYLAVYVIDKVS
jgi:hypothetical protein